MKIVHVTTVHRRYDTRIFLKQCVSLAREKQSVTLVVSDVYDNEIKQGVVIKSIGKFKNRITRVFLSPVKLWKICKNLDADLYQFHDPENLLFAVIFKFITRKTIVFDSHENFPKQLKTKDYLHPLLQFLLPHVAVLVEKITLPFFDAIITATPAISKKLKPLNTHVVCLQNFPLKENILAADKKIIQKKTRAICYVGSMSEIRNIEFILDAISLFRSDLKVIIAGNFSTKKFEKKIKNHKNWPKVDFRGVIAFADVKTVMTEARLGVVMFKDAPNHVEAQPNKLYEYLSASLPVISSNFPLWRNLIEDNNCGICLDPQELDGFVNSIESLIDDEDQLLSMGNNGRHLIETSFNWNVEFKKMKQLYMELSV